LFTTWLGLLWGLAQGVRHALEPDHLAALSTLVADKRTPRSAAGYALAWGAGHALMLLAVGGVFVLVRTHVPDRVAASFEFAVAVMLVALGVSALRRAIAVGRSGPAAEHVHAFATHVHAGPADHVHLRSVTLARRPLIVGCVHGLAGSGALTALVLSEMKSTVLALVCIAIYGGGAALGMATLAGLAGVPLARLQRTRRGVPALLIATGALSLGLGLVWGWSAGNAVLFG
jgi:hypothetical protein